MIRELGSERRESVWFISSSFVIVFYIIHTVREENMNDGYFFIV